jgi:hypothetical protein
MPSGLIRVRASQEDYDERFTRNDLKNLIEWSVKTGKLPASLGVKKV